MKNKLIFLISVLLAFFLGALSTYIIITKQQMDEILYTPNGINESKEELSDTNSDVSSVKDNESNAAFNKKSAVIDETQKTTNENNLTLNSYSKHEAQALVKKMPDYVLEQYIDKFMAKGVSEALTDKRRFAERAIEELYSPNDNQQLAGVVKIGFSQIEPDVSEDTSNVTKFAKIYAHLDTKGGVPNSNIVFIKWVNNQTGQVLLFEQKAISANSNQNWVSFKPDDGWTKGSYDVRFISLHLNLHQLPKPLMKYMKW